MTTWRTRCIVMHHFSRYKRRDDAIAQQLVKEHMHQLDVGETWVGHGGTWGAESQQNMVDLSHFKPSKVVMDHEKSEFTKKNCVRYFFHGLWGNKTWG